LQGLLIAPNVSAYKLQQLRRVVADIVSVEDILAVDDHSVGTDFDAARGFDRLPHDQPSDQHEQGKGKQALRNGKRADEEDRPAPPLGLP
jgi:hypothetical protein